MDVFEKHLENNDLWTRGSQAFWEEEEEEEEESRGSHRAVLATLCCPAEAGSARRGEAKAGWWLLAETIAAPFALLKNQDCC